jgi:hypothetical protein
VHFDVNQAFASPTFAVQTGIAGSWYDPAASGQGFNFEVLSNNGFLAYFYTFDKAGHNLWLSGTGSTTDGNIVRVTLAQVDGGFFPPNFDPTKIHTTLWGDLKLTFHDCNHATAEWTPAPANAADFAPGSLEIQRLTSIPGLACH